MDTHKLDYLLHNQDQFEITVPADHILNIKEMIDVRDRFFYVCNIFTVIRLNIFFK